MQEEVEQKTLTLSINAVKMTGRLLKWMISKYLAHQKQKKIEKNVPGAVKYRGKQTLKALKATEPNLTSIEITDQNIKAFSATAKKYGIDFALKKDTTGEIPRYLVFFKGRDADAVTAAFREFSAKNLAKEKKPSIRKRLTKAKEQAKRQELERGEKVKNRDRGLER